MPVPSEYMTPCSPPDLAACFAWCSVAAICRDVLARTMRAHREQRPATFLASIASSVYRACRPC
eukprot:106535-Chlamydomonas_euryale.AAC.1